MKKSHTALKWDYKSVGKRNFELLRPSFTPASFQSLQCEFARYSAKVSSNSSKLIFSFTSTPCTPTTDHGKIQSFRWIEYYDGAEKMGAGKKLE